MQFKVVGKRLIFTDRSHEITKGENLYDEAVIILPRYHDGIDNSLLSHRLTVVSENGSISAAIILSVKSCTEKNITLTGRLNENVSAVTGNVTFILTCIDAEGIAGKFSSIPFTINDDPSLASLPDVNIAEQILNQTHLEAEKAIKASLTPAPAQIYPASETNLGGVKVDGKTITASKDGTISASKAIASISDLSVQIAHPNNFLIYDDTGKPSVMVAIPKFYLDEVIDGASHTVHPAFIINGGEQDVIYISKYQNIVEDGRAYSLPMKNPAVNVNFDQAWNYCKNKGAGWHLMTNAEWAAIALWCKKNGALPKGNNYYGKDVSEQNLPQHAISAVKGSDGKINKVLTGSGPENWYHNNKFSGIADLVGNIHEWSTGVRLNDGEIQIIPNNDAADCTNPCTSDSSLWKAVQSDGSIVSANGENTLKYDWKSGGITVSTNLTNKSTTAINCQFKELKKDSETIIPEILKSLALFPIESEAYESDRIYVINSEEQFLTRGGNWTNGIATGIFRINLDNKRTKVNTSTGFRCAYYVPNAVI